LIYSLRRLNKARNHNRELLILMVKGRWELEASSSHTPTSRARLIAERLHTWAKYQGIAATTSFVLYPMRSYACN
jgi:hypothetical protein